MNKFETQTIYGFDFVKIGEFYENKEPLITRNKKPYNLCINLIDDGFAKLGESAYVVLVEDEIRYVGEYVYNFKDRWLRQEIYSWHHIDHNIPSVLEEDKSVTIWVTINPYITIGDNEINISKSIENEILKNHTNPDRLWNKRGKLRENKEWIKKNCKRFHEIVDVRNSQSD